ncbi:MAG: 50S ribosomal protein L25 [Calditrichaceae bacterium]|nr:50S ribosomal protein L25 [Calditrichaceae bacterium]MBN2710053.1 50S ribosomal protein L25 [Calditrichaceae bacterium]RQV97726.1 MAG: 50S ribosomal protein L25 [Calditrichota bacterium]
MTDSVLIAEKREKKGKAEARRLRRLGKVPVNLYGEGKDAISLAIDAHELDVFLRQGHSLINIKLGEKEQQSIIREIQRHPVNSNILHVDFLGLTSGHKITLSVPLHFEGTAKGLKQGGRFFSLRTEAEIEVLPKDVPDVITINIENLGLNESLRIKDLVHENVVFLDDPEEIICRIEIPKIVEEVVPEAAEEEAEEAAEPEVITAKEKEEAEE